MSSPGSGSSASAARPTRTRRPARTIPTRSATSGPRAYPRTGSGHGSSLSFLTISVNLLHVDGLGLQLRVFRISVLHKTLCSNDSLSGSVSKGVHHDSVVLFEDLFAQEHVERLALSGGNVDFIRVDLELYVIGGHNIVLALH